MLVLKHITKVYTDKKSKAKDFTALEDINITFPRRGFVSILGPSGCGKTTLLNILGGLDTNYSGEFIVNNIDTKTFKKNDWDAYRNNHVGFVFQEYNLIPHQSVSKNVELVLTIAGASKIQTKETSKQVLENVGLNEKIDENINSLSGGQKQRVAIARALVNDPELILADEPTSALDSKTSEQVMDILKKISKKKLVIMVTHNMELAKKYSSRIINLLDGKLMKDEKLEDTEEQDAFLKKLPQTYKYGKSKMKFKTAAMLSLKNLASKKRRTFLTAIAGSVGIICLAIILGVAKGATKYVTELDKAVQNKRPVVVTNCNDYETEDAIIDITVESEEGEKSINSKSSSISGESGEIKNPQANKSDETKRLEKNLEEKRNKAKKKYHTLSPEAVNYIKDSLAKLPDTVKAINIDDNPIRNLIFNVNGKYSKFQSFDLHFEQIPETNSLDSCFEFVGSGGRWPTKKEEILIVLDEKNSWSPYWINTLGTKNKSSFSVNEFIGKELCIIPIHNDYYQFNGSTYELPSKEKLKTIASNPNSIHLTCVGVIKPKKDFYQNEETINKIDHYYKTKYPLDAGVCYTKELGDFMKQNIKNSDIVKYQLSKNYNVLNSTDKVFKSEREKMLTLRNLGFVDAPSQIDIYIKNPEKNKKILLDYLNKYKENDEYMRKFKIRSESNIQTTVKAINDICLFLGCTIGLAAILTSIVMIALLTFISVLERTKEIGVLRSIGARKKDISRLFKSEALIIGSFTGVIGISISLVCQFILNSLLKKQYHVKNLSLVDIDVTICTLLITFSLLITLFAAMIPAKIASRKDPVKILTGR